MFESAAAGVALGLLLAAPQTGAVMTPTATPERKLDDMLALMADAKARGLVGVARKKAEKPVDARPARAGEIVVTMIKGQGKETQSRPARQGDLVVRSRNADTGNEQYLVGAEEFEERYRKADTAAGADGWQEYRPKGKEMLYYVLPADTKAFSFVAPWGESMVAQAGDAIMQDPKKERDVYRIAAKAFADTYDILQAPKPSRP